MRRQLIVLSPLVVLVAGWGSPAHAQWSSRDDRSYAQGQTVRCESRDNRIAHCDVYSNGNIRLYRQLSGSACIRNRSWGTDSRGVWVSSGCRAEFTVGGYAYDDRDDDDDDDDRYDNRYGGYGNDDRYGYGNSYGNDGTFRCESRDHRTVRCATHGGNAYLMRQLSDMPCRRGQSWGTDRYGVWVSNGCRALFRVDRYGGGGWGGGGWDNGGGWGSGGGWGGRYGNNLVRCESRNNHSNSCTLSVGRNGSVRLLRQLSDTPCIEGQTWGRTNNGVWVTRGCRAEFVVGAGSPRQPGDLGDGRPPGGNRNPGPLPPGVIVSPPGGQSGGAVVSEGDDDNARNRRRLFEERRPDPPGQIGPAEPPHDVPRVPRQVAFQTPQPGQTGQPGGFQGGGMQGPAISPPPPPPQEHPRLQARQGGDDDAGGGEPGHETP